MEKFKSIFYFKKQKRVKEPTDIGNALGKSNHKQHKLSSDPTLIKVKAVRSEPTITVRFQSNGSHRACVLMSHRICVTRTQSPSSLTLAPLLVSAIPGGGETLPTVQTPSFAPEPHYSRVFATARKGTGFHQSGFLLFFFNPKIGRFENQFVVSC
ncbi:unnamed protein product [Sphenostylis stenocarpa]|uniref:Uncharacterized protein n=1 Tax=Sphenostylis stenocarpa TaxID=92480 RepID=A0AA86SM37_9FABA|nr:unnamed protein product [Sphenostylis stenocarpa]